MCLQCGRSGFDPWVGKIPWRRERLPTLVFWPGEFHGLYSPWGCKESDVTERLSLSPYTIGIFCPHSLLSIFPFFFLSFPNLSYIITGCISYYGEWLFWHQPTFPSYLSYSLSQDDTWAKFNSPGSPGKMVFVDQLSCYFISLRCPFHRGYLLTSYSPRQYTPWGQDLTILVCSPCLGTGTYKFCTEF